jgi:hypothetical protein
MDVCGCVGLDVWMFVNVCGCVGLDVWMCVDAWAWMCGCVWTCGPGCGDVCGWLDLDEPWDPSQVTLVNSAVTHHAMLAAKCK